MQDDPRAGRFVSLGAKMALGMALVIVVASTFLFFELTGRERRNLIASKVTAASMVADLFAASLSAPLDFGDTDAIESELRNVRSNLQVLHGAVWGTKADGPVAEFATKGPPPDSGKGRPGAGTHVTEESVVVARDVVGRNNKPLGVAVLTFSLAAENEAYATSRARIFWLCLALAGCTATLLVLLTRRQIVTPLERLLDAVRQVERGESSAGVDVRANDEIGRLATAFNAMNAAIFDREQRLEAANRSLRELLDNMRQAIVVFDREGRVGGAQSQEATVLFGRTDFEGVGIRELLYPEIGAWNVEANAFAEWLELAFEVPADQWNEVAGFAPHEIVIKSSGGEDRLVELEFRPILQDDKVARIMLLAADESEKHRLKRVGEEYARQAAAMRRLVSGGGQVFVGFLEGARRRIARCDEILGPAAHDLRVGEIDELFQHIHTIKGEAQTFDLLDLVAHTRGIEELLATLRTSARASGAASSAPAHAALKTAMTSALETIAQAEAMFVEASPIGQSALEQITVNRSDVLRVCELLGDRSDDLGRVAARLASRPFGEAVSTLADRVPTWAEGDRKRARLEVEGREVLVPPALARVLSGVLVHLVRNAIAHGIELPVERERLGKPPVGLLRISCRDGEQGPTIRVEDDGGGIAAEELDAAKGARPGAGGREKEHIFTAGFSTAPTGSELAGRGVGLSAVRAELKAAGYHVVVESEKDKGARFELCPSRPGFVIDERISGGKQVWRRTTGVSS